MTKPAKKPLNPQAQYKSIIKEIVANEIRVLENALTQLRLQESWCYRNSVPTEDDGEYFFNRLNESRDEIRKIQSRLQTVREAQRIVKKLHPDIFTSDVADGKFDDIYDHMYDGMEYTDVYLEESSLFSEVTSERVSERFDKMLEQMQNKQENTAVWFNTTDGVPPEEYDGVFRK
jgi:Mg2+ and Co2+ transporter CorA